MDRIADIVNAAAGLLGTRARLAGRSLERSGLRLAAILLAGLLAAAGLAMLLTGGMIALAAEVGWPGSLAIIGGLGLVTGATPLIVIAYRQRNSRSRISQRVLEARDQHWREALKQAVRFGPAEDEDRRAAGSAGPSPDAATVMNVIAGAMKNPASLMAGVIAVSGVLGIRRTWGLLSKLALVSGTVLPLVRTAAEWLSAQQQNESSHPPTSPAAAERPADEPRAPGRRRDGEGAGTRLPERGKLGGV